MDILYSNWPWYIAGPLIAVIFFLLTWFGKNFGMSSNLRTICASCGGGKAANFFDFDWKAQRWNIMVLLGVIIGGFISFNYLMDATIHISEATKTDLQAIGIEKPGTSLVPTELFGTESFGIKQFALLALGGLLIGFGARYAGGCTSGHAISGLSNMQWPSLLAVVGFFIGGLIMTWGLLPMIL